MSAEDFIIDESDFLENLAYSTFAGQHGLGVEIYQDLVVALLESGRLVSPQRTPLQWVTAAQALAKSISNQRSKEAKEQQVYEMSTTSKFWSPEKEAGPPAAFSGSLGHSDGVPDADMLERKRLDDENLDPDLEQAEEELYLRERIDGIIEWLRTLDRADSNYMFLMAFAIFEDMAGGARAASVKLQEVNPRAANFLAEQAAFLYEGLDAARPFYEKGIRPDKMRGARPFGVLNRELRQLLHERGFSADDRSRDAHSRRFRTTRNPRNPRRRR